MTQQESIVEKLSQFNNMTFTKKQWEIILKGCGCPKSAHFWTALRNNNLQINQRVYTLIDLNIDTFNKVWAEYCSINRASVMKVYYKEKARKQARERVSKFTGITFYMVNGALSTEKPERD